MRLSAGVAGRDAAGGSWAGRDNGGIGASGAIAGTYSVSIS
jgi:hypothetical protein